MLHPIGNCCRIKEMGFVKVYKRYFKFLKLIIIQKKGRNMTLAIKAWIFGHNLCDWMLYLTLYIFAQTSNDLGLVTSYNKQATSQLSSVVDIISLRPSPMSISCNCSKIFNCRPPYHMIMIYCTRQLIGTWKMAFPLKFAEIKMYRDFKKNLNSFVYDKVWKKSQIRYC